MKLRDHRAPARRKAAARLCRVKRPATISSVHPTVPSRGFMPRLFVGLSVLIVPAIAAPTVGFAQDSLIFSCATFPPDLSPYSLAARFGADNLVTQPVSGLDDGPTGGTVLFPNDSAARVQIQWRDPAQSRPRMIMIRGEFTRWQTVNGITLRHDLRTLERGNGRSFQLTGFRTEVSGMVQSWSGGRLELPDTPGCRLAVYLYPRPEDDNPRVVNQVGRGTFSSGHPAMQQLNPRVVALVLLYDGP